MLNHQTTRRRPGSVLVGTAVLLAAAVALTGLWARSALVERNQLRQREYQLQARRLAEAGAARARAQLVSDPTYEGELWQVAAAEIGGRHAATVAITAQPAGTILATADYPTDSPMRVRATAHAVATQQTAEENDTGDEP